MRRAYRSMPASRLIGCWRGRRLFTPMAASPSETRRSQPVTEIMPWTLERIVAKCGNVTEVPAGSAVLRESPGRATAHWVRQDIRGSRGVA